MADWSRQNAARPRKLVLGLLAGLLVLGLALGLGQVALAGGSLIFQVEHGGDVDVTESAGSHHSETYKLKLQSQPSASVTIALTFSPAGQITLDKSTLTFTQSNYNNFQTVTVTAVDDSIQEGDHTATITHTSSSADGSYNGLTSNLTVDIDDNDWVLHITETAGNTNVAEGGATDTYKVHLAFRPGHGKTVTVTLTTDGVATVSPTTLTFSYDNWDDDQTVTVTAYNDPVVEPSPHDGVITHTLASGDSCFSGRVAYLKAHVTDNDTAGVTVSPEGISATEGGAGGSYTVVLTSQPTADVTVYVSADAQVTADPTSVSFGAGGEALGEPVVFTSTDWDDPQTITVAAVDDSVAEGDHEGTITHESASEDSNYDELDIDDVTVDITDNDTAGVTVSPASISATEGGDGGSYYVGLTSEPVSPVTISLNPDGQVALTPTSLTFLPGDYVCLATASEGSLWNEPQLVTVTAVDDTAIEGGHIGIITHEASSEDPDYSGIPIGSVTVNITDNDFPIPPPVEPEEEEGCCSPPRLPRVITSLRDMDGHWAEREAELVTSLGIMDTLPGNRFGPDSAITRAEYIRMIGLALGCPAVVVTVPFKDVRKTDWFYADVMKGLDSGIVLGTDGRYLRPDALITREEAAVMLARALVHCGRTEVPSDYVARLMLASFTDGDDVSGPALRSMALVVYYDIMVGQNSTSLAPKANLTRAEGALTLSRFWYWLVRRG